MSLGLPESVMAQARAAHEANLPDLCRIDEETSRTWDEPTQKTISTWAPVHLDVPCRVPAASSAGRVIITGETVTPVNPEVKIPIARVGVEPDMRVTVLQSRDPDMVGAVLWVTHNRVRSLGAVRTLECRWVR